MSVCVRLLPEQEEQRLKLAALRREEAALTAELTAFDARLEAWEARRRKGRGVMYICGSVALRVIEVVGRFVAVPPRD